MSEEDIENALQGMVTLQERMVHLIQQLSMPLVEVSMVVSKQISGLMKSLNEHIELSGETFPSNITQPWQLTDIDTETSSAQSSFELEKVMSIVDEQRMDILDTLIRVTLIETDSTLADALLALRPWEQIARTQLSKANGPGQLFSPIEIPEDW
ncbi:MAG: hypothetical protein NZ736_06270 [Candidatus Poseidoniaceae archaeon]|nr:hypothetical protein [Candidatus Poseidoniaceae archaeon]